MEMDAFIFYIWFSWLLPPMLACRIHKDMVGISIQTMDLFVSQNGRARAEVGDPVRSLLKPLGKQILVSLLLPI